MTDALIPPEARVFIETGGTVMREVAKFYHEAAMHHREAVRIEFEAYMDAMQRFDKLYDADISQNKEIVDQTFNLVEKLIEAGDHDQAHRFFETMMKNTGALSKLIEYHNLISKFSIGQVIEGEPSPQA